jgi:hypothetical protein
LRSMPSRCAVSGSCLPTRIPTARSPPSPPLSLRTLRPGSRDGATVVRRQERRLHADFRVGVAALPLRQGSLSSPAALSRGGPTRSGRRKEQGRSGTRRPPARGGAGRDARWIWSRSKEELRRWPPSSTRAPTATASSTRSDGNGFRLPVLTYQTGAGRWLPAAVGPPTRHPLQADGGPDPPPSSPSSPPSSSSFGQSSPPATARSIPASAGANYPGRCATGCRELLETLHFCLTKFLSRLGGKLEFGDADWQHCWRWSNPLTHSSRQENK